MYRGLSILKLFVAMLLFFTLVGCATQATKLVAQEGLSKGEGALLLVSHCAYREGVKFEIQRITGNGPSKTHTHTFAPGTEFGVFKFPPGRYSLKRLIIGPFNLTIQGDGMDFDILPNRISYFGDVYISDSGSNSVAIRWVDRQEQAESILQTRFDKLIDRYPLEKVEVN